MHAGFIPHRFVPIAEELWPFISNAIEEKVADDFLFTNSQRRRLDGWAWQCSVRWSETGMNRRVHDLRHTAATLWLSSGVPPKIVQAWLGHSSATLTLYTYSHFLPKSEHRAGLDIMNDILGDARQNDTGGGMRDYAIRGHRLALVLTEC